MRDSRAERSSKNGSFRTMREIYLSNENVTERQISTRPYNSIVNTCVHVEDRHLFPRQKRHRCSLKLGNSIPYVCSVRVARYMVHRYKLCYFPYYDSIIIIFAYPFHLARVILRIWHNVCTAIRHSTRRVSERVHEWIHWYSSHSVWCAGEDDDDRDSWPSSTM